MIRLRDGSSLFNLVNYGGRSRLISRGTCIGLSCLAHHKLLQLEATKFSSPLPTVLDYLVTRCDLNCCADLPALNRITGQVPPPSLDAIRQPNTAETLRNLSSCIAETSERDVSRRANIRSIFPSSPYAFFSPEIYDKTSDEKLIPQSRDVTSTFNFRVFNCRGYTSRY